MFWVIASTVVAFGMALAMIIIRLKAAQRPTSVKRIIMPPLFMSTGAFMFFIPYFQISWDKVLESFIVGMIFSIFLIKTSKFDLRGGEIYLNPSRAFPFILFGLLLVRLTIKLIVGSYISIGETTGMFFMLAFGMILTWRLAMLYQYVQFKKQLEKNNARI